MPAGFANSFMAAKDYAEQERAQGRNPSPRELSMVAMAGADDPMFALRRKMMQQQATSDALKITAQRMKIEMENKQLEGAARLGELIGDGRPVDSAKMDEALNVAVRFNLPQSAIEPIISRYNEHAITTGRSEFIKRLGLLPADLRTPFGMIDGAPSKEQWSDLGIAEETAKRRGIIEEEDKAKADHLRKLELYKTIQTGKESVEMIRNRARLNPSQTRTYNKRSDAKSKLAELEAMKANGTTRVGQYPGIPIDQAIAGKKAIIESYEDDLKTEGVSLDEIDSEGMPTAEPQPAQGAPATQPPPSQPAPKTGWIPESKWGEAESKGYKLSNDPSKANRPGYIHVMLPQ